ncbi:MAG TPA: PHB depolymerase family esterase [Myxococcales bacterium]|jgi:predicted esterase|nr:PHB depolymerase family esterase [Myxococcales bacterium]
MLTGAPGRLAFPAPPPDAPPPSGLSPGVHRLASESGTAYLYVPGERPGPRPLLVVFHGAGGEARWMIDRLSAQAEARGVLLLAPQSAGPTWDLIRGEYGVDAAVLQQMLTVISTLFQVDPSRIGAAGFSDGASYALSLGLDNGDVFSSVMAFSPGFATLEHRKGSPRVFVSHGTADQVLNVDACGRAVVKRLRELGYGVTYQEFDGKHTLPPEVAAAATEWFTGS